MAVLLKFLLPPVLTLPRLLVHCLRSPLGVLIVAALFAAMFGLFVDPRGFRLAFGLVSVLALGLAWPGLSILGVRGEFEFNQTRGREGEPTTVTLRVRNLWPLPLCGLAIDEAIERASPTSARVLVPLDVVLPWRTNLWSWQVEFPGRGLYPCREPKVVTGFPFGLWMASRNVTVKRPILVWPAVIKLDRSSFGGHSQTDQQAAPARAGNGGDLLGVRSFRHGDRLRHVHWPQTARHGRLIVREHEALRRPTAQIVLDTRSCMHSGQGRHASFEWAIRIATSILESFLEQGMSVELVATDARPFHVDCQTARSRCLDMLAQIEPVEDEMLAQWCAMHRGSQPEVQVVICTTRTCRDWQPVNRLRCEPIWIVLDAERFEGSEHSPHRAATVIPSAAIYLDESQRVAEMLSTAWKGGCHAS